jgi:hypothetical protein
MRRTDGPREWNGVGPNVCWSGASDPKKAIGSNAARSRASSISGGSQYTLRCGLS